MAAARAAVVLLTSGGPATRLVRLVAIGPPTGRRAVPKSNRSAPLLHAHERLSHPDNATVYGTLQPAVSFGIPVRAALIRASVRFRLGFGQTTSPVCPTLPAHRCLYDSGLFSALSSGKLMPGVRNLTGRVGRRVAKGRREARIHDEVICLLVVRTARIVST